VSSTPRHFDLELPLPPPPTELKQSRSDSGEFFVDSLLASAPESKGDGIIDDFLAASFNNLIVKN
jgi:hypothetical protein